MNEAQCADCGERLDRSPSRYCYICYQSLRELIPTLKAENERLRELITALYGPHGKCWRGMGYMFNGLKMDEDCANCAAKRELEAIAAAEALNS